MSPVTQAEFSQTVCEPFIDLCEFDALFSDCINDFGGRREKVHSKELAELATYMSSFSYDAVDYKFSKCDVWVDPILLKTFLHCVKDAIKFEEKKTEKKARLFVGWHGSSDYDSMFKTAQVFDLNFSGKSGGMMRGNGIYLSYIPDIAYEYPMPRGDKSAQFVLDLTWVSRKKFLNPSTEM